MTRPDKIGTRPTSANARKTHCNRGHEFTPQNTRVAGGKRRCRTCQAAAVARHRAKRPRRQRPTTDERFWPRVDKNGSVPVHRPQLGRCWIWTGGKGEYGHGTLNVDGKATKTHRYSYEQLVGAIPADLALDHLCRNPPCVNPTHLEPVSHRENTDRGEGITARNMRKTHCKWGHEFTPDNTMSRVGRAGRVTRQCRTCHRASSRRGRSEAGVVTWDGRPVLEAGQEAS